MKYETPNVLVIKDTFNEPTSVFNGLPHYKIKCGSTEYGGSEASCIGVDNLLAHFGMLMQECHRLRWIIKQTDRRIGGSIVHEITEETQEDYEVLKVSTTHPGPQS